MDWKTLRPALTSLFASLASEDMSVPLPEGTVTWFGDAMPFISPETQAGIYLRVVSHIRPGKPATRYSEVDVFGRTMLKPTRVRQDKLILQVQAKSLEDSDGHSGQAWIDRILDNLWDGSVLSYLRRLGLGIIRVRPPINLTIQTPVDGTDGWDTREISAVSVDIELHLVNSVDGLPIDYIASVATSGTVTGNAGDEPLTLPERTTGET